MSLLVDHLECNRERLSQTRPPRGTFEPQLWDQERQDGTVPKRMHGAVTSVTGMMLRLVSNASAPSRPELRPEPRPRTHQTAPSYTYTYTHTHPHTHTPSAVCLASLTSGLTICSSETIHFSSPLSFPIFNSYFSKYAQYSRCQNSSKQPLPTRASRHQLSVRTMHCDRCPPCPGLQQG